MDDTTVKSSIVRFTKLVYDRGYTAGSEGNISARLPGGDIFITASGVLKCDITESAIIRTDSSGKKLDGDGKPSSERFTHLAIYRKLHDVGFIIHAHPVYTTLGAAIGLDPLSKPFLAEAVLFLQHTVTLPYTRPSTGDTAAGIDGMKDAFDILIAERHGVFCTGKTLEEAFNRLEVLEKVYKMGYLAHLSGNKIHTLSKKEIKSLKTIVF